MEDEKTHSDEALRAENEALRAENEALRAENERLMSRVEELARAAEATPEESLRESAAMLQSIMDNTPLVIFAKDREGRYTLINRRAFDFYNISNEAIKGKADHDFFSPEIADLFVRQDREIMQTGKTIEKEMIFPVDGEPHFFVTTKFPLRDSKGQIQGVCAIAIDRTAAKRAELENHRLQEEIIHSKEATLWALSTPLLPIAKGVLVIPLIGELDRTRAERVLRTLLDGIAAHASHQVIIDVTGVPTLDTEVAASLVTTARAVRLLGATVILTGIRPEVAQALVMIGADLTGIVTPGTLESGIAHALGSRA